MEFLCIRSHGPLDSGQPSLQRSILAGNALSFGGGGAPSPPTMPWLWGRHTVVLIFPFSVVMLSLWCRCAKGLAAPQDSKYRVMRTDALILAPSRVWRGLKRCWGLRRSPLGGETASQLVHSNLRPPSSGPDPASFGQANCFFSR